MNKENMLKWAEALESGQYEQYRGGWNNDTELRPATQHCCLDVACLLFEGKGYCDLPAGIEDIMEQHLALDADDYENFIQMNDDQGKNFNEIAAHIRDMVEEA